MIICDRQQFIDCVNGDLLERNAEGVITKLGDAASFALEAHEEGKRIFLTANGEIVTSIQKGIERLENKKEKQ